MKKISPEIKVGLFAMATIAIITFVTIRVGDQSIVSGGAYELRAIFTNATGLYPKASVEVSGVAVGIVKKVELTADGKALVIVGVKKAIHLPQDSAAYLKTRGFLGEAYVELVPGDPNLPPLKSGDFFAQTESGGDVTSLVNKFNSIAGDVKDVTRTVKDWTNEKEGGQVAVTVSNMNEFVQVLRDVVVKNQENLDRIVSNMADLTHEVKTMVQESRGDVTASMDRMASITQKIDEGRGTIGKLVNDPETADKLNSSLDSLNDALGGYKRWEMGLGFHTEYLQGTSNFKNYFHVSLAPTPDKALIVEIVTDPEPPLKYQRQTSDIQVGGTTTTVTTDTSTLNRFSVLFSAELAKKFYDFTIRGGLIESTGGMGLDYDNGVLGLKFDAFNFQTHFNQKPHLKAWGILNVTQNLYLAGGADDFINPNQPVDYFVGGGFQLVDDDIKSLIGTAAGSAKVGK
ncbi:MAG: MlaD family protein [Deltaproteobacteria bacterium]|nr:MlaD family protein [Deltaproteobacteria bacterium]